MASSEHLYTYVDPPNPRHLAQIVEVLRDDGVIAMPAGTNWVFAADPRSKRAHERIRRLKPDHPHDRPFALLCSDISMATRMVVVDGGIYKLLKRIWPGPYTVLLKANRDLPRLLSTRRKIVGVRVPTDPLARVVLDAFGGPLTISTVPQDTDGQHRTMGFEVHEAFGHELDLVLDLGDPLPGTETTVLDLSEGVLEVLRVGAGEVPDI